MFEKIRTKYKKLKQSISMLVWLANNYNDERALHLRRIDTLRDEVAAHGRRAAAAEKVIRDRTDIAVDASAHSKGYNQVILTGRYRGKDYVQIYSFPGEEFKHLVDHLREICRYGTIRRVDAAPAMRAVMERDAEMTWGKF